MASPSPLGGKPEFPQVDGAGKLYVNIEGTGEIAVVDMKGKTVLKRWSLAGCEEPTGLQLDRTRPRLFSVCGSKVMVVVNTDDGKTTRSRLCMAKPPQPPPRIHDRVRRWYLVHSPC